MKQYCPECGDDRYAKGYKCMSCGFPHTDEDDNDLPDDEIMEDEIRSQYEWGDLDD